MSEHRLFNIIRRIFMPVFALILMQVFAGAAPAAAPASKEAAKSKPDTVDSGKSTPVAPPKSDKPASPAKDIKPDAAKTTPPDQAESAPGTIDQDDPAAVEKAEAELAAVAKPVSAEPVQVYGWREYILINGVAEKLTAKLDTGAFTSSIHAEEKELFERDGKKWVRFIVTDPTMKKPARTRIEAPLVRIAKIKEPGAESVAREVVRLGFQIGDRKMRGEFTLNNRANMLAPVLIGRTLIKDLGMVDPAHTHLAEQKIFR